MHGAIWAGRALASLCARLAGVTPRVGRLDAWSVGLAVALAVALALATPRATDPGQALGDLTAPGPPGPGGPRLLLAYPTVGVADLGATTDQDDDADDAEDG